MSGPEFESVREQLRAMAETDAGRAAGPGVGTALLAAFREQAGYRKPKRAAAFRRSWAAWAALGAAAAALVWVAVRAEAPNPGARDVSKPGASSAAIRPSPVQIAAPKVEPPKMAVAGTVAGPRKRRAVVPPRKRNGGGAEVATRFYALGPGVDAAAIEGLPAVRVRVPRTTLASFGLPVDVERLNQPVKADVVLGEDGMARAIRFVSSPADRGR